MGNAVQAGHRAPGGRREPALREPISTVEQTVRDVVAISGEADGLARASRTALQAAGVNAAAVDAGADDALDPLVRLSRANRGSVGRGGGGGDQRLHAGGERPPPSQLTQAAGELQGEAQRFCTADGEGFAAGKALPVVLPRVVDLSARQTAAA